MVKKYLFLLFVVVLANSAFAQAKNKTTAPASKTAVSAKASKSTKASKPKLDVAPKLEAKEPSFTGFTGSFIEFGEITGDERSFAMTIEYKPWFFKVTGTANAGYNTPDLGADVIAVLAYYDAQGKTADGTDYQAGFFDIMMYLDDKPIKMSNLKFTLIGGATLGSSVLTKAEKWNFQRGMVFRMQKYYSAIIKAQAAALDKFDIEREEAVAQKRAKDSIAKEEKKKAVAVEDNEEKPEPPQQKKGTKPKSKNKK